MATGRELTLGVNPEVAAAFERLEPRHIALLVNRVLNPDKPLSEIAKELWPDLAYHTRHKIVVDAKLKQCLAMVKAQPFIMASIMGNKIAPVMVSVLYTLALDPDVKSNVRATAAKELIRLAQSTSSQLASSDTALLPVEEIDELLDGQEERDEELRDGLDDEARVVDVEVLTADELANL